MTRTRTRRGGGGGQDQDQDQDQDQEWGGDQEWGRTRSEEWCTNFGNTVFRLGCRGLYVYAQS